MSQEDQEIMQLFVEESREHLTEVETELLAAEASGGQTPPEVINKVFRCVHSIKGGAGFLGLEHVKELSHQLENVVGLMREERLIPSPEIITVLLQATDRLRGLVEQVENGNDMEIAPILAALQGLLRPSPLAAPSGDQDEAPGQTSPPGPLPDSGEGGATLEVASGDGWLSLQVAVEPLSQELEMGSFVYLVEFDPAGDARLQGQNPVAVLQEINQAGGILADQVESADRDHPEPGFPRSILYATLVVPDLIDRLVPVEPRCIQHMTQELRQRLEELRCLGLQAPITEPAAPGEDFPPSFQEYAVLAPEPAAGLENAALPEEPAAVFQPEPQRHLRSIFYQAKKRPH